MTDNTSTPSSSAIGMRPWLAVASVAAGAFVVITTEFLPIGLLGTIAADVHVSVGTAGLMVAIPGLVAAVAAPALTLLTNKIDRRLLLIGFAALVMLSNLIVALSSSFEMILAGRVLLGICVGVSGPSPWQLAADWSRSRTEAAQQRSSWPASRSVRW